MDLPKNRVINYQAVPGVYRNSCGHLRCLQNYFEVRFFLGPRSDRAVGFHMGRN